MFGVDVQLTWGADALVTAELGVIVSFPDLELVVLGSIESVLPDADAPELELHMDALGVIDLSEGTVWITAALYDSAIAQTIHVSGDMAIYARFGATRSSCCRSAATTRASSRRAACPARCSTSTACAPR